jgi:hypothetical protein
VPTPHGRFLVYPGYSFDKDTIVKNSPDWVPSLIHDFLYDHRIDFVGGPVDRLTADKVYYFLNKHSLSHVNRRRARHRYYGVRAFGGWAWYARPKLCKSVVRPKPIPPHALHLYGL